MPPASRRARRRRAPTSWSCSAATARSTRRPTGWPGTRRALAALPGGSTNVFARTIGLPNDPIEATGDLLAALAAASIRRVGLGSVNGRYFLFHVGIGFDAAVVAAGRAASRAQALRRPPAVRLRRGSPPGPPLRPQPAPLRGHHADGTVIDDGYFAHLPQHEPVHVPRQPPARPRPGGHARPRPGRGHPAHDGVRPDHAHHRRPAFVGGRVPAQLDVDRPPRRRRATSLVEGHGPFPYQVDGDYLGDTERLEFRHEPDVLDLVVP